ncbi:MAG: class I SAM-dependent methyltransferase [Agriterribacter sp.]
MPDYNAIASSYDFLSRLIFGDAIKQSQVCLLPFIPAQSNILIAGGGTGWILDELAKVHQVGLNIIYVESSSAMIERAKKRNAAQNKVSFFCMPIEKYVTSQSLDIIITPYLFDNFTQQQAAQNFYNLHKMLKPRGLWLFSDFYIDNAAGKFWQKALLKTMYLFFSVIAKIEAHELVDMNVYFEKDYTVKYLDFFFKKFIRSSVWQKRFDDL